MADVGDDAPVDVAPVGVSPASTKYWKGGLAVAILAAATAPKAKSDWGKLSIKATIAESSGSLAKFAIDNVVMVAVSVENGFVDGLSQSLWFEGPPWFSWIVRMLRYFVFGHQSGFWNWLLISAPIWGNKVSTPKKVIKAKAPVAAPRPPSPRHARSSVVSDPASDADDTQCLAHMVSMSMDTGLMPLPHRECADDFASEVRLLTPDLLASHLPDTYDLPGIKLRRTHSDVYAKLRGTRMCAEPNCANAGQSDSMGLFFCRKASG